MRLKFYLFILAAMCGFFIAQNVKATCSNYTTFADGQILTAGSLNSLQTTYTNCVNEVLNGDIFTGDMSFYSGTDAIFYTDIGSTKTVHVDGATGDALLAPRANGAYGLTLSLSAATLTVQCRNSACSSSNPAYVVMNSTTAGQQVTLKVTSGGAFNDDAHASSDLTNLGFGITETANWAEDVPYFLYVANRGNANVDGSDGNSVFFLSRVPHLTSTPSSANDIGDTGAIPANDSQSVILILSDVTIANYTSKPVELIGAIRMRWASATTDWTVQTLGQTDGVGESALQKTFSTQWTMPTGQNGAASGSYFSVFGGTAPTYTATNVNKYSIDSLGRVQQNFEFRNAAGGTVGAGTNNLLLALPYSTKTTTTFSILGNFVAVNGAALVTLGVCSSIGTSAAFDYQSVAVTAEIRVTGDTQNNATRVVQGTLTFNAL